MTSFQSDFVINPQLLQSIPLNEQMQQLYLADEEQVIRQLLDQLGDYDPHARVIFESAKQLVQMVRDHKHEQSALDAFMHEYDLSSEEGVMLMCIAEALLRIPDGSTAIKLIEDKLIHADWQGHLGKSESLFVNASTWGLLLTGRIFNLDHDIHDNYTDRLKKLIKKGGEPVIEMAIRQSMKIMGHQFVMGKRIEDAITRSLKPELHSALCSFDMLGEAAVTDADAERYFQRYLRAIRTLSGHQTDVAELNQRHSISVKLSALHPRYHYAHIGVIQKELLPQLKILALAARESSIALTIDAEESDRVEISLAVLITLLRDPDLKGWDGLGVAIQTVLKRAMSALEWLVSVATETGHKIPLRLVKGAYWDTEIKLAQDKGLPGYPVFTRKVNTDVSFLACSHFVLRHRDCFYPQFATHNAHTIAAVLQMAGDHEGYEFQRLHGMGDPLYQYVKQRQGTDIRCRVYAPVGHHEDLLPYLVRRLLENGANASFVNRIVDEHHPVAAVVSDPVAEVRDLESIANPDIPLPVKLFGELRDNSKGLNLASFGQQKELAQALQSVNADETEIGILSSVTEHSTQSFPIIKPQDHRQQMGHWREPDTGSVKRIIRQAASAQTGWDRTPVQERARCLEKTADLIQQRMHLFIRLCIEEAGKTIDDAVAEVREAVDFCRYYAALARRQLGKAIKMPGPTGESNELFTHGRGVFICISPWNFPLAIFSGQVSAALVSGNAVIAKPAEQTSLIAWHATQCFHQAGAPREVLHLVPGRGNTVGAQLCASNRIAGVAFTGSTETARLINRTLAARTGAIATLIAETGGQNAMLVDSSALPEQVVKDVLQSAFGSSGQRCSALRVLFLQRDIADKVIELLAGAMKSLVVGDPRWLETDVGPVIDVDAKTALNLHIEWLFQNAKLIARCDLPESTQYGTFIAPHAFEISSLDQLDREHFGPILHVIRFNGKEINTVIDQVNNSGYGLTLGVHSRIEKTWLDIMSQVRVGNCYVNRNMVGAVVGVQPFGGEGLSGTGPKAGGPHYLYRFITERTQTINTAAIGGNAGLLSLKQ